jgi:hypothetical protein
MAITTSILFIFTESSMNCTQGLSMLLMGFAKLDHTPEGDLLEFVAQKFGAEMHDYQHQAVANIFYSLARLQQYQPSVCEATQKHVWEHVEEYTPQVSHPAISQLPAWTQHCQLIFCLVSMTSC